MHYALVCLHFVRAGLLYTVFIVFVHKTCGVICVYLETIKYCIPKAIRNVSGVVLHDQATIVC